MIADLLSDNAFTGARDIVIDSKPRMRRGSNLVRKRTVPDVSWTFSLSPQSLALDLSRC